MLPPPQASTNGATQARIASEVRTPNGTIKWGSYLSKRSTLEVRLVLRPGFACLQRANNSG